MSDRRIERDRSAQVLRIELPDDVEYVWNDPPLGPTDPILSPRIPDGGEFVSAAVLAEKAKQFDDGLYACVERAAQTGIGRFPGKERLLRSLAARVASDPVGEAVATVIGATELGGMGMDLRRDMRNAVDDLVGRFREDELRSRPISFYTWFPDLRAIFQQDRLLQTAVGDAAGVAAVARALRSEPALAETYQAYLRLIVGLTNTLVEGVPDVLAEQPGPRGRRAFFPPSRAHETDLARRLLGTRPIPEGFQLIPELMSRIAAGDIDLRPRPDSGWYDHLTWALEPLLRPDAMPEAPRLEMDEAYRGHLRELFQGILARTRETHIKQPESLQVGAAFRPGKPVRVAPELAVEPLAELYLRRGLAYGFVRELLEERFGAPALTQMRRLTARGAVATSLADELNEIQSLFFAAHAAVRHELGMAADRRAGSEPESARTRLEAFASQLSDDPDLGQDARGMVPLFHDVGRGRTKVLVFLGWADRSVVIRYVRPPAVRVVNRLGLMRPGVAIDFVDQFETLVYPVTEAIYVSRLLDREEFQKLCDRHRSRRAILDALR